LRKNGLTLDRRFRGFNLFDNILKDLKITARIMLGAGMRIYVEK